MFKQKTKIDLKLNKGNSNHSFSTLILSSENWKFENQQGYNFTNRDLALLPVSTYYSLSITLTELVEISIKSTD